MNSPPACLQQFGQIRSLYTGAKHLGMVRVGYNDVRHAALARLGLDGQRLGQQVSRGFVD